MNEFQLNNFKTRGLHPAGIYHLREARMSLAAKGLLCLLVSMPDNADFNIKTITSMCFDDEATVKKTVQELWAFNYIQLTDLNVFWEKPAYSFAQV